MRYADAYNYINSFTNYETVPGLHADTEYDGLERVRLMLRLLGRPHRNLRSIVVAGTKGKGSVAAMLDSVLRHAGHSVGLFTSPHLHSYRERIRVNGEMIGTDDVVRLVTQIMPVVERMGWLEDPTLVPTTYEITAAMAFLYFQERAVDLAVLEVGLGGRLDAVNVVEPLVSVLTSISLDHTQVLGNTIAQIAREKAGIIKQDGLVVSAPQVPDAMNVINEVAEQRNAQVAVVGREVFISTDHLPEIVFDDEMVPLYQAFNVRFDADEDSRRTRMRVKTPLLGSHQQVNTAVALTTLRLLVQMGLPVQREAVVDGMLNVQWPGRLEVVHRNPIVLADGAHNVDSMTKLNQAMGELFHRQKLVVVLGTSGDKDIPGMVEELATWAGSILGLMIEYVITTKSRHPRAASPTEIALHADLKGLKTEVIEEPAAAFVRAEQVAVSLGTNEYGPPIVLITGSLFIVAEAREHYGLAPDLSEET
ncbi:MAG TPA: folylpolyglutamate synthase/dihydrofolate synthase family protein [Chloroflexia bacterium]|jgi:dihydrofolate synthase/folylpolyglutamate synthase|nr:folylpolyglutamate synthase/dihydrofolate synthase family protein [Chloroflexia bacterium]